MALRIMHFLTKTIVVVVLISYYSCHNNKELDCKYVGRFEYLITNDSLLEKTHLYGRLGYIIGDLDVQGLEIKNVEPISTNHDYIISMHHPIKTIYSDSEKIRSEGQTHLRKKPLDIVIDTTISTNHIYVYSLGTEDYYRLLLP